MKTQAMSGKKNKGPGQRLSIISLIIQYNWELRCRVPTELEGNGNENLSWHAIWKAPPGPTSSDLCCQDKDGRPMAKACGGFKSSNHKHPPKEEVCILLYPNVYFFLVGVCNRGKVFAPKLLHFHDYHFLLETSVLWDYIKSLHNSMLLSFLSPSFL